MNAWLPQASYPCGNFSDTSSLKFLKTKGSIGHAFAVCIHTENQNQVSFYPFILHEISVLIELTLGHLCYRLTDVPPQPNSQPDYVFCAVHQQTHPKTDTRPTRGAADLSLETKTYVRRSPALYNKISKLTSGVVVFHLCLRSHLCYTSQVNSQSQTKVKLNRVFFPR